jgi:hypothetical protein
MEKFEMFLTHPLDPPKIGIILIGIRRGEERKQKQKEKTL